MSARLLVVDDAARSLGQLAETLNGEYYDVVGVATDAEAGEVLQGPLPDIVILGPGHHDLCGRIKADPRTRHIPVIILENAAAYGVRIRALAAGADDCLVLPVDELVLLARIRSLVRLKRTIDEWQLREETTHFLGALDGDPPATEAAISPARILLACDNPSETALAADALAAAGDAVAVAPGARTALARALDSELDLIIVSLSGAGEDPLRLCSQLRSATQSRQCPILLLLEGQDTARIAKGLDLGVNDCLLRPWVGDELRIRVQALLRRKRHQDRLRANYMKSLRLALTDALTGLYNRRYLNSHLEGQIRRLAGSDRFLSMLMIDIDNFKVINDHYGHLAGDEVLREVGARIRSNLRGFDTVARYGGEEFAAIMPDCPPDVAALVADRLRAKIAETPVALPGGGAVSTSVSIGLAAVRGGTATAEEILAQADDALYQAKRSGRDRVMVFSPRRMETV